MICIPPDAVPLEQLIHVCDRRLDGVDVGEPPLDPRDGVEADEGPWGKALVGGEGDPAGAVAHLHGLDHLAHVGPGRRQLQFAALAVLRGHSTF